MKQRFEKNELRMVAVEKTGFHSFPLMFHSHIEVLCVQEGSICVTLDSVEYELRAGELCVVLPYVLHSYEDAPNAKFRLLMASPSALTGLENTLMEVGIKEPVYTIDAQLDFLTERIVAHMAVQSALADQTACAYMGALVGELLMRHPLSKARESKSTVAKDLLIYCNEHFTEAITIRSAAKDCFVSESFVSKIFARELNIPFRGYVNALRINYAKRMLEKTDMKITEVMAACGFKNQSSFNRIFFSICNVTPRQYREAHTAGK